MSSANCGGTSSGSRTTGTGGGGGKGGSGGTTGSGGSGGTTGNGGATGTGGSGDASTVLSCSTPTTLTSPLLSDFSTTTWRSATGKWGAVGNLTGSIFAYHGPMAGTTWPTSPTVTDSMTVSGTVAGGDYAGAGMAFDQCVNTTTYTGIQFTLGGDVGGCSVQLQVQTYEQQPTTNKGGCVADADAGVSCYHFPNLTLATSSGVITVHWTDLTNGMPTTGAGIAAEMLGFQWQMVTNAPPDSGTAQLPCTVTNFSVDDVQFVTN